MPGCIWRHNMKHFPSTCAHPKANAMIPRDPNTSGPTTVIGEECWDAYAGHRIMTVRRITGRSNTETMDQLAIVPMERDRCRGKICKEIFVFVTRISQERNVPTDHIWVDTYKNPGNDRNDKGPVGKNRNVWEVLLEQYRDRVTNYCYKLGNEWHIVASTAWKHKVYVHMK